ncbi:fibronectin type III domain-containing protein [Bacteroides timonensis]|uniref:fibronectin type III domain-containing protein n=1 Tax=Bacteroides timonensis TaxID=1470345 RepID=UPI0005C71A78|nr:fibronectin type III domain-containing protein [Bacteroides timonensis]
MKKYTLISFFACLLLTTACENDDKLSDTRVPDETAATISLSVVVEKYDATFSIALTDKGNPAVREYGVLISTVAQPSVANSIIAIVEDINALESTIKQGLTPGTTYYACAYALTANQMITSDVKQFKTEEHPLGAFAGSKTLSGYSLYAEADNSVPVTISLDAEDEAVAYINGLGSEAGVNLALGAVKLVFDKAKGTVTIPDGQIIAEKNYGNYRYVGLDAEANPVAGVIVGTIEGNSIKFNALGAIIIAGGNSGLFHWAYFDLVIQ